METRADKEKGVLDVKDENSESIKIERKFVKRFEATVKKVIILNKIIKVFRENEQGIRKLNMADEFKMTLPIFDGIEYSTWKKRITVFLRMKKCEKVIQREKEPDENETTWNDTDLKAMNYIYSALSNRQMEFVDGETTSYEIIKKLDKLYLRESTALQICVRNKLERIKLKDYTDTSEFYSDFEKIIIELKNAGATVTEKEKLNYMLRTLPSSLSHIGDLIDVLPEKEKTVEYLINKIKMYEEREKDERGDSKNISGNSNVFKSELKKDKTCYKCGKAGHIQYECTSQINTRNSWKGSRVAVQQNARGGARYHQERDGSSQRRNNGNYRSRGIGQRGRGGYQRQDRHNTNQGSMTFTTEVDNRVAHNVEINSRENILEWVLDSGCSDHIINDDKYFVKLNKLENPVKVKVGDGRNLEATGVGDIKAKFVTNFNETEIELKNVLFVKEMDRNLMSFGKIANKAKIVSFGNTSKIYASENNLIAIANKENNLYKINTVLERKHNYVTENVNIDMPLKERYHRILGHVNFKYLNILSQKNLLIGLPKNLENEYLKCGTCVQNKMTNTIFENNRHRASGIGEIIHADVNGPHQAIGYQGERYFLILIDDYSKAGKVYTIKGKNEVYDCIVTYVNQLENLTGKRILRLRCDNGREFLNKDIYNFAKEKGIYVEPCPPYVHELNGTAERYNRSVMETARCLLTDAKINIRFWPEVVKTAVYLNNRTLANTIEEKTPYEIMMGEKPDIKNLKLYGSRVFVRVPEVKRKSKWDRKADLGILVGYETVGYRVLINNKITIATHVDIVEENVKLVGFKDNDDINENDLSDEKIDQEVEKANEENGNNDFSENEKMNISPNINRNENLMAPRRSERKISPVNRYGNPITNCIYVNYVSVDTPETYNEAIDCNDSEKWRDAMNREIECLDKNNTWTLVEQPKDKKILDLKWVYTKKGENKFKARIVVKGFQQREILEDIYSPVARTQTLKILLNYCVQNEYAINQMDVESAFLNGKIISEVYVRQPQGYNDNTGRVCKLEKALYGLRESPRAWYECLYEYLRGLGFERSKIDYCLYYMENNNKKIYLIIFIDDLLICSRCTKSVEVIKRKLSVKFRMKDMGQIKTYLGITFDYDRGKGVMTLDQENYIESLAKKYEIENAKLYATPMEQNLKCEPALSVSSDIKYRNLIGALLYISSSTRPDICYCVNYLSRFQNCYDQSHYKYALRILKYLYYTKILKLKFEKNIKSDILDCCVDADWAGDINDRKSTTGYVIRMYGNTVFLEIEKARYCYEIFDRG